MRILTVANYLDATGGLERTQLTNCRGLARRGHRVDLVYVHDGAFTEAWRDTAQTLTQVPTTLPRRAAPRQTGRAVAGAIRQARRLRPDVVYAYRYWDLPFAAAVAAGRQTEVVYHLCLPPPESVPRWMRPVLARVDTTVSVSRDTLDLWRHTGLRTDGAVVALTSVDLETYRPAPETDRRHTRSELGISPDDFLVFFGGRIAPEKGVDVLVDAFTQLTDTVRRSHLVIVGSPTAGHDPELARRYEQELHARNGGLPVTWLPRRDDIVPLLQAADVAVVPSRWAEPLSRSILEPLACGIPVVATRVGGSPEVLTGWLDEFLVDPEDSAALARRITSLADWHATDPTLGDRCRGHAETHLAPDRELDLIEGAMLGGRDQ